MGSYGKPVTTRMKGGGFAVHHGRILRAVITPKPGIAVFKTGMGNGLPKKVDKLWVVNIIWEGLPADNGLAVFTKHPDALAFYKKHVGMTPSEHRRAFNRGDEAASKYSGSEIYEVSPAKLIDD